MRTDIIAVITQRRPLAINGGEPICLRGGCPLVLDRREDVPPIRYSITVSVFSASRAEKALNNGMAAMAAERTPYGNFGLNEPFAMLHRC